MKQEKTIPSSSTHDKYGKRDYTELSDRSKLLLIHKLCREISVWTEQKPHRIDALATFLRLTVQSLCGLIHELSGDSGALEVREDKKGETILFVDERLWNHQLPRLIKVPTPKDTHKNFVKKRHEPVVIPNDEMVRRAKIDEVLSAVRF